MAFNNDEAIGKLIRRYNETKQQGAGLRSSINDVAREMTNLARALSSPEEVVSSGSAYLYDGSSKLVNHSFAEDLPKLLTELQSVLSEMRPMEDCLRQAGLQNIINDKAN